MNIGRIALLAMDFVVLFPTIVLGNPLIFFTGQLIGASLIFLILSDHEWSLKNIICIYFLWMTFAVIPEKLMRWMME